MTSPLIVPIHLEAICIGSSDAGSKDPANTDHMNAGPMSDFDKLPFKDQDHETRSDGPFLGDLRSHPPSETVLETGVHLHWALPKALTRGETVYRINTQVLDELARQGVPSTLVTLLTPTDKESGQSSSLLGVLKRFSSAADSTLNTLAEQTDKLTQGTVAAADAPVLAALNSTAHLLAGKDAPSSVAQLGTALDTGAYTRVELQLVVSAATALWATSGGPADLAVRATAAWLFYSPMILQSAAQVEFPAIPNRWLLVRLPGTGGTPAAAGWVIESDYLSPPFLNKAGTPEVWNSKTGDVEARWSAYDTKFGGQGRLAVPDPAGLAGLQELEGRSEPDSIDVGELPYKYLGRALDVATNPKEDPAASRYPLTALGYGEPSFAAFYPNCREVFGHYDADVKGMKAARLSYAVIGWHSDPKDDPLHDPPGGVDAALAQLGWTGPDDNPVHAGVDGTLYYGLVSGVKWDPARSFLPSDELVSDVAIGNTAAEALAAWIAATAGDVPNTSWRGLTAEDLFLAVHEGLATHLQDPGPDAAARLESALHNRSFVATDGGRLWRIAPARRTPEQETTFASDFGQIKLDSDDAHTLNDLNQRQMLNDRFQRIVAEQRWQLFSDINTHLNWRHDTTNQMSVQEKKDAENRIEKLIKDSAPALVAWSGTLPNPDGGHLTTAGTRVTDELAQALKLAAGVKGVVQVRPAPRFWHPADPVLLLVGKDVEAASHFKADTGSLSAAGRLRCRTLDQTFSSATPAGKATVNAQPNSPVAVPDIAGGPTSIAAMLLKEAAVLDESINDATASGTPMAVVTNDQITPEEGKFLPAPMAVNVWGDGTGLTNPWQPLFLSWSAQFKRLSKDPSTSASWDYAPDFLSQHNATLDSNDIDLTCGNESLDSGASAFVDYSGLTLLSGHAVSVLSHRLDEFGKSVSGVPKGVSDAITAVREAATKKVGDLSQVSALSQSLHGFNQAMLMRHSAYHLPPVDPLDPSFLSDSEMSEYPTHAWQVGAQRTGSPLPNAPFTPIRAGLLSFADQTNYISVLDVFGQKKTVSDHTRSEPIRSRALTPRSHGQSDVLMPPRLVPPSRLLFRWLSSDPIHDDLEMNSHPATTPVCGWVVQNYLDKSLQIFDAAGPSLGSLRLEGPLGNQVVTWTPALGSGQQAGKSFSSREEARSAIAAAPNDSANAHILDFAAALTTYHATPFEDFCNGLDDALQTIAPQAHAHDTSMSALVSRPLALVRAALRLELFGLPPVAQREDWVKALPDPGSEDWDALQKWNPLNEDPSLASDPNAGFKTRQKAPNSNTENMTASFEKVIFQVRLGDASLDEDGLAWCFSDDFSKGTGPGGANATVNLSCANPADELKEAWSAATNYVANDVVRYEDSFWRASRANTGAPPVEGADWTKAPQDVTVAMLIDPRARVHATTGILPMKSIDIPPDQYQQAMHKIAVSFLANPVLLPSDRVQLPLPGAAHHRWRWLSQLQPGKWEIRTEPQPPPNNETQTVPPPDSNLLGRGVDDRAHLSASRSSPVRLVEGWLESEDLDSPGAGVSKTT